MVKEGLPKWNEIISGWISWSAYAVAYSLYALGFGAYIDLVLQEFSITMPHWNFFSPQNFSPQLPLYCSLMHISEARVKPEKSEI